MDLPASLQQLVVEVDGWLDLGCPEQALRKLQGLLDAPLARPLGLAYQARASIELQRYEPALQALRELRAGDHDADWLDLQEAWCLKRTNDLPGATQCMMRLIEREPRSAIGHFNLGCYLALQGRHDPAIDEVTIACGLDQDFRHHAIDEPDLDPLRGDPRFDRLLPPT